MYDVHVLEVMHISTPLKIRIVRSTFRLDVVSSEMKM